MNNSNSNIVSSNYHNSNDNNYNNASSNDKNNNSSSNSYNNHNSHNNTSSQPTISQHTRSPHLHPPHPDNALMRYQSTGACGAELAVLRRKNIELQLDTIPLKRMRTAASPSFLRSEGDYSQVLNSGDNVDMTGTSQKQQQQQQQQQGVENLDNFNSQSSSGSRGDVRGYTTGRGGERGGEGRRGEEGGSGGGSGRGRERERIEFERERERERVREVETSRERERERKRTNEREREGEEEEGRERDEDGYDEWKPNQRNHTQQPYTDAGIRYNSYDQSSVSQDTYDITSDGRQYSTTSHYNKNLKEQALTSFFDDEAVEEDGRVSERFVGDRRQLDLDERGERAGGGGGGRERERDIDGDVNRGLQYRSNRQAERQRQGLEQEQGQTQGQGQGLIRKQVQVQRQGLVQIQGQGQERKRRQAVEVGQAVSSGSSSDPMQRNSAGKESLLSIPSVQSDSVSASDSLDAFSPSPYPHPNDPPHTTQSGPHHSIQGQANGIIPPIKSTSTSTMVTPSSDTQSKNQHIEIGTLSSTRQKGGLIRISREHFSVSEEQRKCSLMRNGRSRFSHSADNGHYPYMITTDLIDERELAEQHISTPSSLNQNEDSFVHDITGGYTLPVLVFTSTSASLLVPVPESVTREDRREDRREGRSEDEREDKREGGSQYLIRNKGGLMPRKDLMEGQGSEQKIKEKGEQVEVITGRGRGKGGEGGEGREGDREERITSITPMGPKSDPYTLPLPLSSSLPCSLPSSLSSSNSSSVSPSQLTSLPSLPSSSLEHPDIMTQDPKENSMESNTKNSFIQNSNSAVFDRKKHQISRKMLNNSVVIKNYEKDELFDGGFF